MRLFAGGDRFGQSARRRWGNSVEFSIRLLVLDITSRDIEIVFTVGGYTMTGLAINSFGIQIEPGYPAFPPSSRKGASSRGPQGE
jgi:hypothetical protein